MARKRSPGRSSSSSGSFTLKHSLIVFAAGTTDAAAMPYADIRAILVWYVGAGLLVIGGLALTARAMREPAKSGA